MANAGTAILDFGAFPGSDSATVAVTDSNILGTSNCGAWIDGVATSNNQADEIAMQPVNVVCGAPTAGVGFTITGTACQNGPYIGQFQVRWAWS